MGGVVSKRRRRAKLEQQKDNAREKSEDLRVRNKIDELHEAQEEAERADPAEVEGNMLQGQLNDARHVAAKASEKGWEEAQKAKDKTWPGRHLLLNCGSTQSPEAAPPNSAEPSLSAQDLIRGLALNSAALAGLRQGLAVEGPEDSVDVGSALRQLDDNGESLFREHCVPLLVKVFTRAVAELHTGGPDEVTNANSRYADDPRTYIAKLGNLAIFEAGFVQFNGRPYPAGVMEQMKAEFASDEEFVTSNYGGIHTTLRTEWEFVESPVEGKIYPGEVGMRRGDGSSFPGRKRRSLDDLMELASSVKAKLLREEVVAVRLYTGPSYMLLNRGLRAGGLQAREKGIDNFPATCAALNSAIKKLRLVTELPKARKLYRGIMGMALPPEVLERRYFVELGFSSATPNPNVAKDYAGSERSSIFEIEVGEIDRGAFIGEYSQYEEEEEHLIAPLAFFEIMGKRREFGVNVYALKLNLNLHTQTLEELRDGRRTEVLEIAEKLTRECQQLIGRDSSAVAQIVKTCIDPVGYEWFNQGSNFSNILGQLEASLLRELEEEGEALRQAADALTAPEAQAERVAKLRACTKLAARCSAGDAEGRRKVLSAQQKLVDAITAPGPASLALTAAAVDDLVELAHQLEFTASDYTQALELLERALVIKQTLQDQPAADVAHIIYKQGNVLDKIGRLDDSLARHRQALDMRVSVLGHEHPDIALSYVGIGNALYGKKDWSGALDPYRKSLEIRMRVFGADHPDVAKSHQGIGNVLIESQDLEGALSAYQKCLEIQIRVFGTNNPDVADSKYNVACVHEKRGETEMALRIFLECVEIYTNVYGPGHSSTLETMVDVNRLQAS
jgi:tetratricopeptide (TPR) repeat protein